MTKFAAAIFTVAALTFVTPFSLAQNRAPWPFYLYPFPEFESIPQEDHDLLQSSDGELDQPLEVKCAKQTERELSYYERIYPEFRKWHTRDWRRTSYLKYHMKSGQELGTACYHVTFFERAAKRAEAARREIPNALCRFSVPNPDLYPRTEADLAFLREAVVARHAPILRSLKFADRIHGAFGFAPDIQYYLSVVGVEADGNHSSYRLDFLTGMGLSDERQAFIRDAASRNDLASVIETMGPC